MTVIRVIDTFHVSGRDFLMVVGTQDGVLEPGADLMSNRGVRLRVAGLGFLDPHSPGSRLICVEPGDADVQAGDVLTHIE